VSQSFCLEGTPKIIFCIPRSPFIWKQKQNEEAVGSTWRLLCYLQFPGKNSHYILSDIFNFSCYFRIFYLLVYIPQFFMGPWGSTELWCENSAVYLQSKFFTILSLESLYLLRSFCALNYQNILSENHY